MGTTKEQSAPTTIHLTMSPMQWTELQDIDDVEPLNPSDYECLAAVREVLKRFGKRDRFGVALLHKHFDLAEDELLMEVSQPDERVLTIKPVKKGQTANPTETIWKLEDGDLTACQQCCIGGVHGHQAPH